MVPVKHALRGMDDHTSRRVTTRKTLRGFRKTVGSELFANLDFRVSKSPGFESTHVHLQFPSFFLYSITPEPYILLREMKLEISADSTQKHLTIDYMELTLSERPI